MVIKLLPGNSRLDVAREPWRDSGPVLERSQQLVAAFLEELKRNSIRQLRDQGGVNDLITELDGLSFSAAAPPSTDQA
jgi:hypothetical protein